VESADTPAPTNCASAARPPILKSVERREHTNVRRNWQSILRRQEIMKFKKLKLFRLVLFGVILLFLISFLSPNLTIQRYVFLHLHPISSINLNVNNMHHFDRDYGQLFDVTGYEDYQTKDEIGVFYLKKYWIFWVVSSVGTGP
jgi:hypothetical protein